MKSKLIPAVIAIVLVIAVGVACFSFGKNSVEPEAAVTVTKYGFEDIGELSTEEFYLTQVYSDGNSLTIKDFKIPLTSKKMIFSYDVSVRAGIDFSAITVEIDDANSCVNVKLPETRILGTEIDNKSFKIYEEKNNVFNPIKIEDLNAAQEELVGSAEKLAMEKGILYKASDNAKKLIRELMQETIPEGYELLFK